MRAVSSRNDGQTEHIRGRKAISAILEGGTMLMYIAKEEIHT